MHPVTSSQSCESLTMSIGIDLGTTNSCMAIILDGKAVVIPNAEGERTTPSMVAFTHDGQRLVGASAKRQQADNPRNTISSIKRFIGRLWNEVSEEMTMVPYLVERGGDDVRITVDRRKYLPQEISAMILQKLKYDAEAFLGCPVTDAVITVPAYFNNAQREATRDAGKIAGLNVLRIINEPTAASLAYGLDQAQEQTVLVFDLGGGTFDASVLELGDGLFDVKSTNGDNHLGGDDFDRAIVDWMLDRLKCCHDIDISVNQMPHLYQAAELAKVSLSTDSVTEINLAMVAEDANGRLSLQLTREKLNELTADLINRTVIPVKQALADAVISPSGIDHVVLVGGMTRMPAIVDRLRQLIDREPHRGVDPDEVVAIGAAIQASILCGETKGVLLHDVTPLSLGIETRGGVFTRLIARNSSIPISRTETFTTAEDNQTSVEIHVLQGESQMAAFNKSLGIFQLCGITPARRGLMEIDVSFDIDANGILHVHAEDIATGNKQEIRIEGGSGLSPDEINRMMLDAEAHAEANSRLRELADVRNLAEILADEIGRSLAISRSNIANSDVVAIESHISSLRMALTGSNISGISTKTRELIKVAQALL